MELCRQARLRRRPPASGRSHHQRIVPVDIDRQLSISATPGQRSAAASTTGLYLSTDSTITTSDTLLGTFSSPSLGAGGSDSESIALSLPTNLTAGTYYLGVIADYNGQISESNETNNASNAIPIIVGNSNANTLTGTTGNDTMFGLAGNDTINGGSRKRRFDRRHWQ